MFQPSPICKINTSPQAPSLQHPWLGSALSTGAKQSVPRHLSGMPGMRVCAKCGRVRSSRQLPSSLPSAYASCSCPTSVFIVALCHLRSMLAASLQGACSAAPPPAPGTQPPKRLQQGPPRTGAWRAASIAAARQSRSTSQRCCLPGCAESASAPVEQPDTRFFRVQAHTTQMLNHMSAQVQARISAAALTTFQCTGCKCESLGQVLSNPLASTP